MPVHFFVNSAINFIKMSDLNSLNILTNYVKQKHAVSVQIVAQDPLFTNSVLVFSHCLGQEEELFMPLCKLGIIKNQSLPKLNFLDNF
jgi:hypothetical protein